MLTIIEKILFLFVAGGALALAYRPFKQMITIIGRGTGPDKLAYDRIPERFGRTVAALFTQGDIIHKGRTASSIFHWAVAIGFIYYFLVNALDVAEGYLPERFIFWSHGGGIFGLYRLLADVLTISVLVGVSYFLVRRFLAGDKALEANENVMLHEKARKGGIKRDSAIIALFILGHVGARWFAASALIAWHHDGVDRWQPFGTLLASILPKGDAAEIFWHIGWWLALGLILAVIPYFPYTKHAHLFMGPLNYGTRPDRGSLGAMNPLDLDVEDEDAKFGVTHLSDLSQTQILDAFACIMCNRCQDACPAYTTGKQLSPAAIEINKRYYIKDNMVDLATLNGSADSIPLLDYALTESALWACTSCGACSQICPVGNEPMMDILDMRRAQVLMADEYPHELATAFQGMERRGNPWGATDSRMEWAAPLPFTVPTVDQNPDFEYLFWVGCAGAFDPHAQKVAQSVATILDAAGVSFAVLGDQETCTGDPARRAGNEYLFQEMAMANIATLDNYKVNERKIVTSCPHCFTTIGTEYKPLGGDYIVFHHTQMIADLVGRNKLQLDGDELQHVTFHDPCYLGRHNGVYDDPRTALRDAGLTLLEMDRHGKDSFCCGAGGSQFWKEEEHGDEAVNINRYEEAKATGAETVAVGCPFCAVMLRDANEQDGSPMEVKDVAQLVAERLKEPTSVAAD